MDIHRNELRAVRALLGICHTADQFKTRCQDTLEHAAELRHVYILSVYADGVVYDIRRLQQYYLFRTANSGDQVDYLHAGNVHRSSIAVVVHIQRVVLPVQFCDADCCSAMVGSVILDLVGVVFPD